MESTIDLLARAKSGDATAVDLLVGRYFHRLRRWAGGRLPGWARGVVDTEDMVQDVLVRTIRRLDAFQPQPNLAGGGFHAYLRQALQNRIRDEIRRARRRPETRPDADDPERPDPGPLPIDGIIGRETRERYEAALDRLKPADREAVIMRLELAMSYEEIGLSLGKPSWNAARMTVVRALERLARETNSGDPEARRPETGT